MWPRMMASGQRADAYPKEGGPPGSSFELMRDQHLDPNGVEHGNADRPVERRHEERNQDFAAALMSAVNDWQVECWVRRDARLRAGIVIVADDAESSVKEIYKRAQQRNFRRSCFRRARRNRLDAGVSADFCCRPRDRIPACPAPCGPSGRRALDWCRLADLLHAGTFTFGTASESLAVSLVMEGVFERFPRLKIAMIESGFSWAPTLAWRMTRFSERMHKELPHLKRRPSEYMREHFWFATQPIEEPKSRSISSISSNGSAGTRSFSRPIIRTGISMTPRYAISVKISDEHRAMIFATMPRHFTNWTRIMPQRHVVASTSEIAAGGRKLVNIAGREIGIFNVAGDYYALANRCPHEGGSLCEGFVTGSRAPMVPTTIASTARANSCAVPGTDGNSTFARDKAGAIRNRCASASSL